MQLIIIFLKSLILGVFVAAPVGPMSTLCMRHTLKDGWKRGIIFATGIATADAVYASIAAFGLSGISGFMLAHEGQFSFIAGILLVFFATVILFHQGNAGESDDMQYKKSTYSDIALSFFMTLANPLTILFFVTVFTGFLPSSNFNYFNSWLIIFGVFSGSILWWGGIVAFVSHFRNIILPKTRIMIDRITATALLLIGFFEISRIF
ncbi:MAG: LysE family transporter [Pseudomonadota bacterium]